jgi:hypothetical protein
MRSIIQICFALIAVAYFAGEGFLQAQLPDPVTQAAPANAAQDTLGTITRSNNRALDASAGQYWATYDLKPYTEHLKSHPKPQQAIVDWVIRETGSDLWFNEPMGILTASRDTLSVYHNDGVHQMVKKVYERFVNGSIEPQNFTARIVLIGSPNWRTNTLAWMRSVDPKSPGIQGWLLNKEQTAMLMSTLRARNDYAEVAGARLEAINGQPQFIENLRTVSYAKGYRQIQQPNGVAAYIPSNDSIREGYQIKLVPILTPDEKSIDMVVQCSLDQVERLNPVPIQLPGFNGQPQTHQITVPQMMSWRLEERFQWPSDQTLVLSCGVVAPPAESTRATILNTQSNPGFLGLGKLIPQSAATRADALLIIEYNGPARKPTDQTTPAGLPNSASTNPISRGRY